MAFPSPTDISKKFYTRDVFLAVTDAIKGDVVDFGAGMSRYKKMIMEHADSYTTMDIQAFPGIDIVGDVHNPPFKDASFDTVMSTHVLEHVREPWVMIEQVERVLKPGGMAILMIPYMYPFHADPYDYFRFSEEGIKSLFERVGMEVVVCSKYCGWWGVQSETFKQKYVSPYRKPHAWWKRRLMSAVETTCSFLNRWSKPGIVYANVVCVARKPLSS